MRNEEQMKCDIFAFIHKRSDILAAYLNGSRANPNAPKDRYQDYDLVLVVASLKPFLSESSWLSDLGTVAFIQEPDFLIKHDPMTQTYGFLTLFEDHNRIDLTLETQTHLESKVMDSMTEVIYDPKGLLNGISESSDKDYWIQKPSAKRVYEVVNNFWWCLNNVGKGIVRDEMPYAMHMFRHECMGDLDRVITWYSASQHDFNINVGKHGKWFKHFMDEPLYACYLNTYTSADKEELWHAVDCAMNLMHHYGCLLANSLGIEYDDNEESAMREYIQWIKKH